MFVLRDFLLKTLLGMVAKEPDYKVRQYALSWYDKGELTSEDMAIIEAAIEAQYVQIEEEIVEETEEVETE